MKNTAEIADLFESQVAFIFDEFKRLPDYGQSRPAFIARPRKADTYSKIRAVLEHLKGDITIENYRTTSVAHEISFSKDSKIVIIYADSPEDFKWQYDYHSYSSSIILGKMFKQAGLKCCQRGLVYQQFDLRKNHQSVVGEIVISKDFARVLNILELDYVEFQRGFSDMNEIFEFFIKSPYLNVKKFTDLEKEASTVFLQKFQEYLIANKVENPNRKKLIIEQVKGAFPEVEFDRLSAELLERARHKDNIVNKFNGKVIMQMIPGFEPKKIGISMGYFKHSFATKEQYEDFIIQHPIEEIISKFKEVNQFQ